MPAKTVANLMTQIHGAPVTPGIPKCKCECFSEDSKRFHARYTTRYKPGIRDLRVRKPTDQRQQAGKRLLRSSCGLDLKWVQRNQVSTHNQIALGQVNMHESLKRKHVLTAATVLS
jgi:hypothetical protein